MGRRSVGAVRLLLVVDPAIHIDLSSYQGVLRGLTSWASPDNESVAQVVCDTDPHVIVSIGVSQESALWRMPLWRRRTWVDMPDATVQPAAVKMAALSLLGAVIDHNQFDDAPLVTVVPLVPRAADIVRLLREVVVKQTHENIEVLVSDHLWNEVRDAIVEEPAAMFIRRVDSIDGLTPFEVVRATVGEGRGEWIWPISHVTPTASPELVESLVSVTSFDERPGCIVVSKSVSLGEILASCDAGSPVPVDHFLINRSSVASSRIVCEAPPFGSLGAALALLACDSMVHVVDPLSESSTIDSAAFATEVDDVRRTLLQAPIGFARRVMKSQQPVISG